MSAELTVFTEAIYPEGTLQRVMSFFGRLKFILRAKKAPPYTKYGGHYAVTRSLVEGLKKNNIKFNYNPSHKKDIAANVIVLAGTERLKDLVRLKQEGKIKTLFAGPNIFESPLEEDGILTDPEIDRCIVPSEWIKSHFIQESETLQNKIEIWHAGVDTEYWKPVAGQKRNKVIIYWKTETEDFYLSVENLIRQYGYEPATIKYGSYSIEEYKERLNESVFIVFISRSESQGIAMAEAWSMNVPVYAWDPGKLEYKNRNYSQVTSCPYLTNESGMKWTDLDQLKEILEKTKNDISRFQPRKYALRHFSDEHTSAELVSKFRGFNSSAAPEIVNTNKAR